MTTFTFNTATADTTADIYGASDKATKARMRADYKSFRDAFIRDLATGSADATDLPRILAIGDAMTTAAPTAAPTDYAQLVADHRATLVAAIDAIDAGTFTLPEGVASDAAEGFADKVGVAGDVAAFVKVAGRKGLRGSVGDFIDAHLGDDSMTVAELRAAWTPSADYPKAAPSAGAITAWLTRDNERSVAAREAAGIDAIEKAGVLAAYRTA